jgi:two-component system, NarL family, response regulator NreC
MTHEAAQEAGVNDRGVLLVDDHAGLRAELRRLIESQPELRVVVETSSAQQGVRLAREKTSTVVVMDLSLPHGDGIMATAEMVRQRPDVRVLKLSRHEDGGHVERMLTAGARGYVLKRNAADELLTAIHTIAGGETYISPYFILATNSAREHQKIRARPGTRS